MIDILSDRHRIKTFSQILGILTLRSASAKALGATRRAILEQFLVESVVLAGMGGIIGAWPADL